MLAHKWLKNRFKKEKKPQTIPTTTPQETKQPAPPTGIAELIFQFSASAIKKTLPLSVTRQGPTPTLTLRSKQQKRLPKPPIGEQIYTIVSSIEHSLTLPSSAPRVAKQRQTSQPPLESKQLCLTLQPIEPASPIPTSSATPPQSMREEKDPSFESQYNNLKEKLLDNKSSCLSFFFGTHHPDEFITESKKIRDAALGDLKTKINLLNQGNAADRNQKIIALLNAARDSDIFNEHRKNHWYQGAFGRTTAVQEIDTLLNKYDDTAGCFSFLKKG